MIVQVVRVLNRADGWTGGVLPMKHPNVPNDREEKCRKDQHRFQD
jgi:hypothetical protein